MKTSFYMSQSIKRKKPNKKYGILYVCAMKTESKYCLNNWGIKSFFLFSIKLDHLNLDIDACRILSSSYEMKIRKKSRDVKFCVGVPDGKKFYKPHLKNFYSPRASHYFADFFFVWIYGIIIFRDSAKYINKLNCRKIYNIYLGKNSISNKIYLISIPHE